MAEELHLERKASDPPQAWAALLNSLSPNVAIIDRHGRIEAVNNAWRAFAEANPPLHTNVLEGADYLAVCQQAASAGVAVAAEFGHAIRDILAGRREAFEAEYDCHSPDQQRWFVGRITRYRDQTAPRALAVHENITARKAAELALRDSEIHLRLALEAGQTGTFEWNIETGRVAWSRGHAEMWGIRPESFQGTYAEFEAALHPDDRALVRSALARSLAEHASYRVEYRIVRPDGGLRWIAAQGETLYADDDRPLRMMGLVRDVTAQKNAEEDYQQLQLQLAHLGRVATLGEMVAGIAHEISQPLYSITNFAEATKNLLAEAAPRWDALRQWNKQIAAQAGRAGGIIERLRAFVARAESIRAQVRLHQLLEEAISLVAHEARRHRVRIRREFDNADPLVEVDPVQIEQVLVNLLRNAFEALEETSADARRVAVSTRLAEESIEVAVADNGPGLANPDDRRIFEPFVTTRPNGLGMGLAITRRIIEAHDGRIWASRAPEGGAMFHISLPHATGG